MDSNVTPIEGDGLIDLEIGDRLKVGVKKLNGAELRRAESFSNGSDLDRAYCRALYAVRRVNDMPFAAAKSPDDLDRVAARFEGAEFDTFLVCYNKSMSNPILDEQVRKLLAPASPESAA